jgi:hypothetical protein
VGFDIDDSFWPSPCLSRSLNKYSHPLLLLQRIKVVNLKVLRQAWHATSAGSRDMKQESRGGDVLNIGQLEGLWLTGGSMSSNDHEIQRVSGMALKNQLKLTIGCGY